MNFIYLCTCVTNHVDGFSLAILRLFLASAFSGRPGREHSVIRSFLCGGHFTAMERIHSHGFLQGRVVPFMPENERITRITNGDPRRRRRS